MVQRIKGFPSKLKILTLGNPEILGQRRIQVPETGRAHVRKHGTHVSELPFSRIGRVGVGPEALVRAEGRLKSGGVNPVGNLLLLGAASGEMRITHQIAPGGFRRTSAYLIVDGGLERILGATDGKRQPGLRNKIPRELPS